MNKLNTKQLRVAIAAYSQPSTGLALLILIADIFVFASAISGTIFLENIVFRILCGVIAGLRIGTLFLVAHDAAHNSYTGSKFLNRIIGRICFLPSLHNYSLWLTVHNQLHHKYPNLKGINSWSPLSRQEYDALPVWRKSVEQFYRNPAGICFYYLVERWWKNKFYPHKKIVGEFRAVCWLDFFLVVTYLLAFLCLLGYAGHTLKHTDPVEVIILGFIIPLLVSYFLIGVTVYQHHTHESIPWFSSEKEREKQARQEDVTMHVQYPAWYNLISNNAMEHTAHHIDPRVPLYNLCKAQKILNLLLGEKMITVPFSIRNFLKTMAICKLYDYENHCWLDFEGKVTSKSTIADDRVKIKYKHAA